MASRISTVCGTSAPWGAAWPPQTSRLAWALGLLLFGVLGMSGCGGGGSGAAAGSTAGSSSTASAPIGPGSSAPLAPNGDDTAARRLDLAAKLYAGVPRVPSGFLLEPAPQGLVGPLATLHLKNTDVDGAAPTTRHELCTEDAAEALAWSELRATWQGSYADLVETNASARWFEMVRVPRVDTTARLRHRVFRCDWLDRGSTDLDLDSGAAGALGMRPVTIETLQFAAEYLWQFSAFNNADHVVLTATAASAPAGQLAWRIEILKLLRGASPVDCDRIERLAWTHVADIASGTMTRQLALLETFRAQRQGGSVQLCAD